MLPRGRVKIYVGDLVVAQSYSGLKLDGKLIVRKLLGGGMCLVQKLGTGLLWYVSRDQIRKVPNEQIPKMYFPRHQRCRQCGRDYEPITQAQIDNKCFDCMFDPPIEVPVSSIRLFRHRIYQRGRLHTDVGSSVPVENL